MACKRESLDGLPVGWDQSGAPAKVQEPQARAGRRASDAKMAEPVVWLRHLDWLDYAALGFFSALAAGFGAAFFGWAFFGAGFFTACFARDLAAVGLGKLKSAVDIRLGIAQECRQNCGYSEGAFVRPYEVGSLLAVGADDAE